MILTKPTLLIYPLKAVDSLRAANAARGSFSKWRPSWVSSDVFARSPTAHHLLLPKLEGLEDLAVLGRAWERVSRMMGIVGVLLHVILKCYRNDLGCFVDRRRILAGNERDAHRLVHHLVLSWSASSLIPDRGSLLVVCASC